MREREVLGFRNVSYSRDLDASFSIYKLIFLTYLLLFKHLLQFLSRWEINGTPLVLHKTVIQ